MMTKKKADKRVDNRTTTNKIAKELTGAVLARAFIVAKSAGLRFNINKFDGVLMHAFNVENVECVNVDVVGGIIKKCWITV